jgi:putative intracellular protease/amidase
LSPQQTGAERSKEERVTVGRRILIPLPDRDFDPTEVAVPWRLLVGSGHRVVFATERGRSRPACDQRALRGFVLGRFGASTQARAFYRELEQADEFRGPVAWARVDPAAFDGLLLPGGHAPGMRQYLGSQLVQELAAGFWRLRRPVGAICHGVLVLARATREDGKSLLAERRTTCLPKSLERAGRLGMFWLGDYAKTYPRYVEDEVCGALDDPASQFQTGPRILFARGTATDDRAAFTVVDGNYLSARWLGDAYLFARQFEQLLQAVPAA